MEAYDGARWTTMPTAQWLRPEAVRIDVRRSVAVARVEDQFFVRERNLRWALGYLRRIGVRETVRKALARQEERLRNDRWVVVGTGVVTESNVGGVEPGQPTGFVSASTPRAVSSVVVTGAQLLDVEDAERMLGGADEHAWLDGSTPAAFEPLIDAVVGHESFCDEVRRHAGGISAALEAVDVRGRRRVAIPRREPTSAPARGSSGATPATGPTASLFGYGQYAKTQIIPNLGRHLDIRWVHEVDPFQLASADLGDAVTVTASPELAADEQPDVVIGAGFHHTHVDCVEMALDRDLRYVVLEKPPVTTAEGLTTLQRAVTGGVQVFVAFQRPHSSLHRAIVDAFPAGEPVSYFANVFEVPLPRYHWYRWPCSGTEVLSNGCHWVDHFLSLNPGAEVAAADARPLRSGSVVYVRLANGAELNLVVTHEGAARIGVRDDCFIVCGPRSARWRDASVLIEDGTRVIKRLRTHPYDAHRRMYQSFGTAIAAGQHAPDGGHVLRSAALSLTLDDQLRQARGVLPR